MYECMHNYAKLNPEVNPAKLNPEVNPAHYAKLNPEVNPAHYAKLNLSEPSTLRQAEP